MLPPLPLRSLLKGGGTSPQLGWRHQLRRITHLADALPVPSHHGCQEPGDAWQQVPSGRARPRHPQDGPQPCSPSAGPSSQSCRTGVLLAPSSQWLRCGPYPVHPLQRACVYMYVCVFICSWQGVGLAWEAREEGLCLHPHHHHTPFQRVHH